MQPDELGFLYPVVDKVRCVNCGKCQRVCPIHSPVSPASILGSWAIKAKDEALRLNSSSGGIFSLLAQNVIRENGVVFGAVWRSDLTVVHRGVTSAEDLQFLRGAKYLQSDVGESFSQCRDCLFEGRQVLFSGTPCQVAGLKHFLGCEYPNLLCVQIFCHAVPSPAAWSRFLESKSLMLGEKVFQVSFRDKSTGWKAFSYSYNGGKFRDPGYGNPFAKAFFAHLIDRPSCYRCAARAFRSGADIAIGDCWGVEEFDQAFDDDKGVSVAIALSAKGLKALEQVSEDVSKIVIPYSHVLKRNPQLESDPVPCPSSGKFVGKILRGGDFVELVDRFTGPGIVGRLRISLGALRRRLFNK